MKVVVVGAGVIGIATAWQLAREGHDVTVLDQAADCAAGTSHENGAQLCWSHAVPMPAPGMVRVLLANMGRRSSPVTIAHRVILGQPGWFLRALAECAPDRYASNRRRMVALARYSLACLDELAAHTGIDYARRSTGMLQVFRAATALARHRSGLEAMAAAGFDVELAETPEHIARIEPALAEAAGGLAGALLFQGQSSGDCRAFTRALAEQAQAGGITLVTATRVQALMAESGRVRGVQTATGETVVADLTVLCTGLDEAGLLRGMRHLPLVPVRGRTLTLGLTDPVRALSRSILDEDSRLSVARVADTVRLAGFADLVGHAAGSRPGQTDSLREAFAALFPTQAAGALELSRWTGFRPVTPDGVPMIGPARAQGLWLNMGHGGFGWTMAAGSARLLADLIAGRNPALAAVDYAPHRPPSPRRP